jgi:hypothetical protein
MKIYKSISIFAVVLTSLVISDYSFSATRDQSEKNIDIRLCDKVRENRSLPYKIKSKVVGDCKKSPKKFLQFKPRRASARSANNTFASAGQVQKSCKCTTFCQTITFLNTYDWSAELGGGMTPSQCADAASAHCGGAYNSLLTSWTCENE